MRAASAPASPRDVLHPPVVALRAIQERRGWTAAITRHTSGGGCGLLVQ